MKELKKEIEKYLKNYQRNLRKGFAVAYPLNQMEIENELSVTITPHKLLVSVELCCCEDEFIDSSYHTLETSSQLFLYLVDELKVDELKAKTLFELVNLMSDYEKVVADYNKKVNEIALPVLVGGNE